MGCCRLCCFVIFGENHTKSAEHANLTLCLLVTIFVYTCVYVCMDFDPYVHCHLIRCPIHVDVLYVTKGLSALGIKCASNLHSICIDRVRTAVEKTTPVWMCIEPVHIWRWIGMECLHLCHCLFAFSSYLGSDSNSNWSRPSWLSVHNGVRQGHVIITWDSQGCTRILLSQGCTHILLSRFTLQKP